MYNLTYLQEVGVPGEIVHNLAEHVGYLLSLALFSATSLWTSNAILFHSCAFTCFFPLPRMFFYPPLSGELYLVPQGSAWKVFPDLLGQVGAPIPSFLF